MTKIYKEVVIDMNPESSSYGETLHEDSFEYDGPMDLALRGGYEGGNDPNNPGDWYSEGGAYLGTHQNQFQKMRELNGRKYYIFDVKKEGSGNIPTYYVIADEWNNILHYAQTGELTTKYPDWGVWFDSMMSGYEPSEEIEYEGKEQGLGIETAPELKYSEFSSFIDPTTGTVKDVSGMVDYLQTHGMEGMSTQQITDSLSNMPGLNISPVEIGQAKAEQQSDIYGLQSDMMDKRTEASTLAGISGIYSPTSTGFGGADSSKDYASLASMQETGDVYGLGETKEQELIDWITDITGEL